jgi:hypothetical protein
VRISAEHIVKQGRPALASSSDNRCTYLADDGAICGASVFLTPAMRAIVKNISWGALVNEESVPANNAEIIARLQFAHDSASHASDFVAAYKSNIRELCRQRGYAVPDCVR